MWERVTMKEFHAGRLRDPEVKNKAELMIGGLVQG